MCPSVVDQREALIAPQDEAEIDEQQMTAWYESRHSTLPLCEAAWEGRLDRVKWLLKEEKGNINDFSELDYLGFIYMRPLHCAARNGHLQVVKFLVEDQRAEVEAFSIYDTTPLHCAAREGHLQVVQFLVDHGADAEAKNKLHCTPLHAAAGGGHLQVVKFLVEDHGADVQVKDLWDVPPLHVAVGQERLQVVKFLVDHGADVDAEDVFGRAALDMAKKYQYGGNKDALLLFIEERSSRPPMSIDSEKIINLLVLTLAFLPRKPS
eukprot:Selendium_serpulae@DN6287_c2_g1_i1.p1